MLIAVGGQKSSGKSTLAGMLAAHFSLPVQSFAMPIKKTISELFGISLEDIELYKNDPNPPPGWLMTMREALIYFGDGARQFYPPVFIERALASPCVIADMRYPNEAESVRSRGGVTILLHRPGFENKVKNASESSFTPARDAFLAAGELGRVRHPLFDIFLVNGGTPEDLFRRALALLSAHPAFLSVHA